MTTRRYALAATAASVLLAGCGPTTHLRLDLRAVSITVPRLVTPAVTIVPAAPVATVSLPPIPPVYLQPVLPTPSTPVVAPPPPVPPACPKAGAFDVPSMPASLVVDHPPAPGTYTQQVSGSYATAKGSYPLGGEATQTVTALPRVTSSIGQVIDSYRVARTYQPVKRTSVEVLRLVHPSSSPQATSAGIYLVGLAWDDPVRGHLSFNAGGNGIWVLPDPVAVAQQVAPGAAAQSTSSDTDASTLSTLSVVRNVMGKKRVDACGQLIDTYSVEMTGVLTTQDWQRQVAWTMELATTYGGLDVQDELTLTDPSGFRWDQLQTATSLPKAVTQ